MESSISKDQQNSEAVSPTYVKPQLTVYGSVSALTLGNVITGATDGNNMMAVMN